MLNVATWIRPKDEKWFRRAFAPHPEVRLWNALNEEVPMEKMDGLLLSGGPDIAQEFLRQPVPDPSVLDKDVDPKRDRWEFDATKAALERRLPIFAICKGMQLFNVALGGTLHLDIPGHGAPEMRDHNIQPLRTTSTATHRLEKVNSSHHQADRSPGRRPRSGGVVQDRRHHRANATARLSLRASPCNIIRSAAKVTRRSLPISFRAWATAK